jgi:hypothetical protein
MINKAGNKIGNAESLIVTAKKEKITTSDCIAEDFKTGMLNKRKKAASIYIATIKSGLGEVAVSRI